MAGGSQIIINKNGITFITPAKFEAKAGQHIFKSGGIVNIPHISLPILEDTNKYRLRFHLKDEEENPFIKHKYIAFTQNGKSIKGITDEYGYTEFFDTIQSEKIDFHLYKDEQLDIE